MKASLTTLHGRLNGLLSPAQIDSIYRRGIKSEELLREYVETRKILTVTGIGPGTVATLCDSFGWTAIRPKREHTKLPKTESAFAQNILGQFQPIENFITKPVAGIYLLKLNSKIMYVGQSVNVLSRLANHVTVRSFDEVTILPIRILKPGQYNEASRDRNLLYQLDLHERSLIDHLRPPWNKT